MSNKERFKQSYHIFFAILFVELCDFADDKQRALTKESEDAIFSANRVHNQSACKRNLPSSERFRVQCIQKLSIGSVHFPAPFTSYTFPLSSLFTYTLPRSGSICDNLSFNSAIFSFENFSLRFSSSPFVIGVNLLRED